MRRALALLVVVMTCAGCASSGHGTSTPPSTRPASHPASAVLGHVPVGSQPDGMVYAFGSLWVADNGDGTVTRIDPVHRRVAATVNSGAGAIAATAVGDQLWVANYSAATVTRIDPTTNRVLGRLDTGVKPVSIAAVDGTAWVFCQGDDQAYLFDQTTARPMGSVDVSVAAGFVTVFAGRIWAPDFTGGTGRVVAIDPSTRRVALTVTTPGAPINVSFAAGSGWVSGTDTAVVTRFDPSTGRVIAHIAVPGGSLGPLLATDDAVWVSGYDAGVLSRIDPASDRLVASQPTGAQPQNLVAIDGRLWLSEGGADDVAVLAT